MLHDSCIEILLFYWTNHNFIDRFELEIVSSSIFVFAPFEAGRDYIFECCRTLIEVASSFLIFPNDQNYHAADFSCNH